VDNQGGSSEDQALTLSYSITASGNSAPYPVSYLSSIVSYGVDYAQASGVQSIQLDIQDVGGLDDPDGDNVYFRSTTNFDAVDWITFTENGLIQIDTTGSHSAETFEFYSEDDYGERQTEANFQLTISVSFS